MKDLRRLVTTLVVGSFSVAALLGIVALLGGGEFGETQTRVLLTTVIVGVESIAALCYLALSGHRLVVVGLVGAVTSAVATVLALYLTWGGDDGSALWKTFGIAVTIAGSMAQASLLLALAGRHKVGLALLGTLAAITVVAVLIVIAIVDGSGLDDWYWRAFGVVAILDVLGTVVLTAMGAFGRRTDTDREQPLLSAVVESRVMEAAKDRGTSPSQLVAEMLDDLQK